MQHNNCVISNFDVVLHYFLGTVKFLVFAIMKSLQEEPPCDLKVILTKELSSLPPSGITTNRSVLSPLSMLWKKLTILENLTTLKRTKEAYQNPKHTRWHPQRSSTKAV